MTVMPSSRGSRDSNSPTSARPRARMARRLEVGDVVEFSLCYSHMLYATARSDMHIQFVN